MKRIIIKCMPYVAFFVLWMFIATILLVAYNEGVLSVIKDAFGIVGIAALIVLGLFALTSWIYLDLFLKETWRKWLASYTLTVVFCVTLMLAVNIGDGMFKKFSPELWNSYPARRITMYEDLVENYNLKGFKKDQVCRLLGEPDSITDSGNFIYESSHGNNIYVEFTNNILVDLYCIT